MSTRDDEMYVMKLIFGDRLRVDTDGKYVVTYNHKTYHNGDPYELYSEILNDNQAETKEEKQDQLETMTVDAQVVEIEKITEAQFREWLNSRKKSEKEVKVTGKMIWMNKSSCEEPLEC